MYFVYSDNDKVELDKVKKKRTMIILLKNVWKLNNQDTPITQKQQEISQ